MQTAATLVHKAAMPIGVHAVRTFARHFSGRYRLEIHTDGSPDAEDEGVLLQCAADMESKIVRPGDRRPLLDQHLERFPRIRALMGGAGYFAKLELPMVWDGPRFYFDSDIVWLRAAESLVPPDQPNAFSTESWSWYNGVAHDREWVRERVPRRVNSGFYYLSERFPFARMESMLERGLFDPSRLYNTDQEIMAYLFPNMALFHPEDLKRSRRGVLYDFVTEECAALHFPGQMWRNHLEAIALLATLPDKPPLVIRYEPSVPLSRAELFCMRMAVKLSDSPLLGGFMNRLRAIRAKLS